MVIFTSDNGSLFGNQPLRMNKGHLYEGGIRVPWMVRWPGRVVAGTTCATPVISHDVLPTVLEAVGLTPDQPPIQDGESIMPLLLQTGTLKRNSLYFHYPNYAFHKRNRLGGAIRQGRYKLIRWYDDDSIELYDLPNDIGEQNDLAEAMPELAEKLRLKLDRWLAETGAAMPTRATQ